MKATTLSLVLLAAVSPSLLGIPSARLHEKCGSGNQGGPAVLQIGLETIPQKPFSKAVLQISAAAFEQKHVLALSLSPRIPVPPSLPWTSAHAGLGADWPNGKGPTGAFGAPQRVWVSTANGDVELRAAW